jgi:hypothetical protein
MSEFTVMVVGATGSIGPHAVAESLRQGHRTRALVRDVSRGASLQPDAEIVVGDMTGAETLADALENVDGIVFTYGSHGGAEAAELVDYGAVRNVLDALGTRRARIALMTAIGVTSAPRATTEAPRRAPCPRQRSSIHDRAPRLVRLQRTRPAAPRDAAGRPTLGERSLRRRRLTCPDRRGSRREPHLRRCRSQVARARRRTWPGTDRPGPLVPCVATRSTGCTGRCSRSGQHAALTGAAGGRRRARGCEPPVSERRALAAGVNLGGGRARELGELVLLRRSR